MRIETAQPPDLSPIVGLLGEQFREHRIEVEGDTLTGAVRGLLSDVSRGAVLLAYDPRPIGVAVLAFTWTLEHGGPAAWLDELFVHPEHRGRGVGQALLRRAIEVATERGCRAIDLEVDAEHSRAENLYERHGFVPHSRRRWVRWLAHARHPT